MDRSVRRYRERAVEVRQDAEKIANPEIRQVLLAVADSYERLAASIEARTQRLFTEALP